MNRPVRGLWDDMTVEIIVERNKIVAEVDTAARSVWVNADWFMATVEAKVIPDYGEVRAADETKMNVYGSSRMTFSIWGMEFVDYPVRLLEGLKSKVLIGRSFWIANRAQLDLEQGKGSIMVSGRRFEGPIFYSNYDRTDE